MLIVRGNGFLPTSIVIFQGATHDAKFIDSSQMSVRLSADELQKVGDFAVTVANDDEAATGYLRIEGGTLEVRVEGLPAEQQGSVSITSQSGATYRISATQTLQVPPGTYLVSGNGVGSGGLNYFSESTAQSVNVEDGSSNSLEISYKMVTLGAMQTDDPRRQFELRMMITE